MIRLDKYLSDATGLTRSEAGRTIRSGAVTVNGSVVRKPEQKFDENTVSVMLNGSPCQYSRFRYYLLDKPTGLITASRDSRQETVLDLFPPEIRKLNIAPVGRLDKDTSGLLLLTNDGEFAHRVISPKYAVPIPAAASRCNGHGLDADRLHVGGVLQEREILEDRIVGLPPQRHAIADMVADFGKQGLVKSGEESPDAPDKGAGRNRACVQDVLNGCLWLDIPGKMGYHRFAIWDNPLAPVLLQQAGFFC